MEIPAQAAASLSRNPDSRNRSSTRSLALRIWGLSRLASNSRIRQALPHIWLENTSSSCMTEVRRSRGIHEALA